MMRRILIIASGGGHSGFARAIAQYLPFKADFVVPTGDTFTLEMVKPYAERVYYVVKGREPGDPLMKLFFAIPEAVEESFKIPRYDVVVATGSNHSVFPSAVQRIKGAEVYVVESQDRFTRPGKAVKLISTFSERVFLHWEEQRRLYGRKGLVVGPIVEKPRYQPRDEGYLLVTTGSMGFMRLYKALAALGLDDVVVQTGRVDPSEAQKLNPKWRVFQFDPDIERWISGASAVITHQGKTAMESVVMYGKPTIIVYNRDWRSATTIEDARTYAEVLGAEFLDDPLTWGSTLELKRALDERRRPKRFEIGTPKLVDEILK